MVARNKPGRALGLFITSILDEARFEPMTDHEPSLSMVMLFIRILYLDDLFWSPSYQILGIIVFQFFL